MGEALGLPPAKPSARTETAVSPEQMAGWFGVHRNRGTAEIAERDGQVVLILDDGAPMTVSRICETRYLARPKPDIPGPEFVLHPASDGRPAYLHFALCAYTKPTK
jgi:hypothetical protein